MKERIVVFYLFLIQRDSGWRVVYRPCGEGARLLRGPPRMWPNMLPCARHSNPQALPPFFPFCLSFLTCNLTHHQLIFIYSSSYYYYSFLLIGILSDNLKTCCCYCCCCSLFNLIHFNSFLNRKFLDFRCVYRLLYIYIYI